MFYPPVIFEVRAHVGQAIAELKTLNAQLAKIEVTAGASGVALARMGVMSKMAGTALLGIGAVAGIVAVTSLEALDKVEAAQANLTTAIENTGVAYSDAEPYVNKQVVAMRKLGFTQKDVLGGLAYMTAALGSPKMEINPQRVSDVILVFPLRISVLKEVVQQFVQLVYEMVPILQTTLACFF